MVLEPEAAAAFCLREIRSISTSQSTSDEVNHYLLADCGGGTIDIVAHKLTTKPTGKIYIEEIHQAHGGPYGGFAVNDEFEKMVQKMFHLSTEEYLSVKKRHPRQWSKLISEQFEIAKCMIDPKKTHEMFTIKFPPALCRTIESLKNKTIPELIKQYRQHRVEWDEDENELVLPYGTMDSLVSPVATKIITVLNDVLQKPECQSVNKIVLVGGFVESSLLFSKIEGKFTSVTVKRTSTPWLAVLKGAVMFAKEDIIHSRKMTQTLGIETWDVFKTGYHKEEKKAIEGGKSFCKNAFNRFVEVNESVLVSETFEHIYEPVTTDQERAKIKIFGCSHNRPMYTDDVGCYPVAVIDVDLPKQTDGPRKIRVIMNVSGTEITVSAISLGASHISQPLPVLLDLVLDKYAEKKKK